MSIADDVKRNVTMSDVCLALGIPVTRSGFCSCPFHGSDRHPSMKVYPADMGYCCFTCGSKGSVIDFVMHYNSCTFWDAVKWLNETFSLGLNLNERLDEKALEKARMERERRERERQERHEDDMLIFETYVDVQKVIGELEDDVRRYEPEPWDEHWNSRFCDALKRLPEMRETAEELLDLMERRKREEKQRQARE